MQAAEKCAIEAVHELLFRALVEIRAQGYEHKHKLVFHLANLFHNVVSKMKNAAEGQCPYEEVLKFLQEQALAKDCEKWLTSSRKELADRVSAQAFNETCPI